MATFLCILFAVTLVWMAVYFLRREQRWLEEKETIRQAIGIPAGESASFAKPILELRESTAGFEKEQYLRRLFERLLNEIRQGVVIVDDSLEIKFANRTAAHFFSRDSIQRGRTLLEEFRDHQIADTVKAALRKQRRMEQQIEVLSSTDSEKVRSHHFLVEAAPLQGETENGAWVMIHDVTETTMTEQIRRDFVANASHELRTPLTLINGYIETLRSGMIRDQEGIERCLTVMEKHGRRIERLVEDMLTISRLENHDAVLSMEPFSVRSCVEDVLERVQALMPDREYDVHVDFPADGGILNGDRFYWDQVFVNLIENAIKENPKPDLVIEVSGRWNGYHCVLEVSDNGVGIPAHDLPFVFKRFYRGHKSHSSEIRGTGLGLSIVRRAVEAHGGTIELTSTPGKRTTFRVKVPLLSRSEDISMPKIRDPQSKPGSSDSRHSVAGAKTAS